MHLWCGLGSWYVKLITFTQKVMLEVTEALIPIYENEHDLNIWRMLLAKSKVEGNSIHCLDCYGIVPLLDFLLISLHLRNQANAKKWGGKTSAPQG